MNEEWKVGDHLQGIEYPDYTYRIYKILNQTSKEANVLIVGLTKGCRPKWSGILAKESYKIVKHAKISRISQLRFE